MHKRIVKDFLRRTRCPQCGESLKEASVTILSDLPMVNLVHLRCAHCGKELVATISIGGGSMLPVRTDLEPGETKKFLGRGPVTPNHLLDLHELVQKGRVWSALKSRSEKVSLKPEKKERKLAQRILFEE